MGDYIGVIITAITTIAILFFSIFAKTIYGIFVSGTKYASNFASKEDIEELRDEFSEFREETKKDFRAWRDELERTLLTTSKMLIERELKDISKFEKKIDEFNKTYIEFKANNEHMYQKVNNITMIEDELIRLKKQVSNLEYDDDDGTTIRRTVKK